MPAIQPKEEGVCFNIASSDSEMISVVEQSDFCGEFAILDHHSHVGFHAKIYHFPY